MFKAWTDPKHLARWWGPHGFSNPVCETDLRPGGAFRIVMRSPDGIDYPVTGVYLEPERLVCSDVTDEHPAEWQDLLNQYRRQGKDAPALKLVLTVIFDEHDGKTKLTIRNRFESLAERDAILEMSMAAGWSESLERLEDLVAKMEGSNPPCSSPIPPR